MKTPLMTRMQGVMINRSCWLCVEVWPVLVWVLWNWVWHCHL